MKKQEITFKEDKEVQFVNGPYDGVKLKLANLLVNNPKHGGPTLFAIQGFRDRTTNNVHFYDLNPPFEKMFFIESVPEIDVKTTAVVYDFPKGFPQ